MLKRAALNVFVILICVQGSLAAEPPSGLFKTYGHGGRAGYMAPDDDVRRVTTIGDVETPHVAFARPLDGGPLRVLAIAHKQEGRWPVELSQRFGFEVDTVYCYSEGSLGAPVTMTFFAQRAADVEARLLQAMNRPVDVVVCDMRVGLLGEKVAARLKELTAGGTGFVGLRDAPAIEGGAALPKQQTDMVRAAVPVGGLRLLSKTFGTPEKAARKIVTLRQGTGGSRTAVLADYPRDDQIPDADRLEYAWLPSMEREAWYSLIGRAALWTAKRLAPESPLASALPAKELTRGDLPVSLSLSTPGNLQGKIDVRIWDADGRKRHEGTTAVPLLPCGRYFVCVRRTCEGKTADWAFGWFDVKDAFGIESICLDSDSKKPGEPVRATVKMKGEPPQGSSLRFEIIDNYGRCVYREDKPAAPETEFSGDTAKSLHLYNYAAVRLLGPDGTLLDETRHAFLLARPNPATDDISLMVWEGAAGCDPRTRGVLHQLEEMGFESVLNGTNPDTLHATAAANMHIVPYVTRLRVERLGDDGIRHPCLTNPDHNDYLRKQLVKEAEKLKRFAPLAYSLGDDQYYISSGQEACWSPTCRRALAEWAKHRYGSLEKVNAAWSTNYASFDEIEPVRKAEVFAKIATDSGPLCHWVDHQVFVDSMITDWHRNMSDAVEREDPNAVAWYDCTVEGWMRPGSAFDFWKLGSKSRFSVQYLNPMVHDILREVVRPDGYHGTWYGGYGIYNIYPYYDADTQPWWGLFRGINLHCMYYSGLGPSYFDERLLGADLGAMPMFGRVMKTIDELRAGIARLVLGADRVDEGVTLVYSRPSNHLAAVLPRDMPADGGWEGQSTGSPDFVYPQHWEAMSGLIRDLGLGFKTARCRDLAEDHLDDKSRRLLVFPLNLRISKEETAKIRDFVEGGGVVLADAFPGWYDEHARVENKALMELFGVSWKGRAPGEQARLCTAKTKSGENLGTLTVAGPLKLEGALAHAEADDGTPLLLINKFGKGHAILLNVLSRDYQMWRTQGTEGPFREAVAGLLEEASAPKAAVRCEVKVRGKEKLQRLPASETHRFRLGDASYVGVMRSAKQRMDDLIFLADNRPKPVWIQLPEKAHVYDVRRGVYRGHVDRFDDVLYPGRTEFFALLPYEVRGIDVGCEPLLGGVRVTVATRIAGAEKPTTHVFRIELFDPDGKPRRELARNVIAEDGETAQEFFIGYNATPGRWRVRVKDVATGTVVDGVFACGNE